jgi:hypothetical protein
MILPWANGTLVDSSVGQESETEVWLEVEAEDDRIGWTLCAFELLSTVLDRLPGHIKEFSCLIAFPLVVDRFRV